MQEKEKRVILFNDGIMSIASITRNKESKVIEYNTIIHGSSLSDLSKEVNDLKESIEIPIIKINEIINKE